MGGYIVGEEGFVDTAKEKTIESLQTAINGLRLYRNVIGMGLASWIALFTFNFTRWTHTVCDYIRKHPIDDGIFQNLSGDFVIKDTAVKLLPITVEGTNICATIVDDFEAPTKTILTPRMDKLIKLAAKNGLTFDMTKPQKTKYDLKQYRTDIPIYQMGYGSNSTAFCTDVIKVSDPYTQTSDKAAGVYYRLCDAMATVERRVKAKYDKNLDLRAKAAMGIFNLAGSAFAIAYQYGIQWPLMSLGYRAGMEKNLLTKPPKV